MSKFEKLESLDHDDDYVLSNLRLSGKVNERDETTTVNHDINDKRSISFWKVKFIRNFEVIRKSNCHHFILFMLSK